MTDLVSLRRRRPATAELPPNADPAHAIRDCAIYVDGVRQRGEVDWQAAIDEVERTCEGFVWIGLHEPTEEQLAPIAGRYGATHWAVYQSQEDLYKFLLVVDFGEKAQFEAFWYGEEARDFRAAMSGYFQNPVVYAPQNIVTEGQAVAPVAAPTA